MENEDIFVVRIIELRNVDEPIYLGNFHVGTVLFRDIERARFYLKEVEKDWIYTQDVTPKDIFTAKDEIRIFSDKVSKYGFYLQANIYASEVY